MDLSYLAYPAVVLFLLGCWAEHGANPRPNERYLLILFPPIILVVGFVALFSFESVDSLAQLILTYEGRVWPLFATIDTTYFAAILFNIIYLLFIAALKASYIAIARQLTQVVDVVMGVAGVWFYRKSEERDGWFLKSGLRGVRRMLKYACVTAIVISSILIYLAYVLPEMPALSAFLIPVLATVFVSEVYYALSGETEPEFEDDVQSEGDEAQRVYDYTVIVEALRHYFNDRLLHLDSRGKTTSQRLAHEDFCQRLIDSHDYEERLAGKYCRALVHKGVLSRSFDEGGYGDLDHDMAQAMVRLLHGQSVLVATAFFHDYLPYVFFPMVARLMRNERVLVIAGPQIGERSLRDFLEEGLTFVSGDSRLWTVDWIGRLRSSATRDFPDVGVISFSELLDAPTINSLCGYLEQVTLTLVLDSSGLLSTYQIGLSFLAEHLSRGHASCYCVFDRNHDGLVDALSQTLRTSFTEVVATEYTEASSVGLFWDADGDQLQHRIVSGVATNLGMGTELALVALKQDVQKVTWASGSAVPVVDIRWIDGQYYSDLMGFAELPVEQRQLDESIEFEHDIWSLAKRTHRFVVAEDEEHNLFETFRQYATRASEQAFVNVISPNYLFRDYMVANAEVFSADPKAIPAFSPDFTASPRNAAHSVLMLMMASKDGSVAEEELVSRLRFMGLECDDAKAVLQRLIDDYVDVDEELVSVLPEERVYMISHEVYDDELKTMVEKRRYALAGKEAYGKVLRQVSAVPIATEAPDGTTDVLGSHLLCHAYQIYLPGQFVTIRGKYYQVESVSDAKGVILRRAADHFDHRHYYRPLMTVTMGEVKPCGGIADTRMVSTVLVTRSEGDFTVSTQGYLDLRDYGDLVSGRPVMVEGVPDRVYKGKRLLRLDFVGATQPQIRAIATVLSEALPTLYPKDHDYIKIVVPEAMHEVSDELVGFEMVLPNYSGPEEAGSIYVIEDSLLDIGLLASFDRNVERILSIVWDYLDWAHTRGAEQGVVVDGAAPIADDVEGEVSLDPEGEPSGNAPSDKEPADEIPSDETVEEATEAEEGSPDTVPEDDAPNAEVDAAGSVEDTGEESDIENPEAAEQVEASEDDAEPARDDGGA